MTEGRNTGIPTIQRELEKNGSPAATFDTDEDRLSFLVRIPCHEGEEGFSETLLADTINNKGNDRVNDGSDRVKVTSDPVNDPLNTDSDPVNVPLNSLSENLWSLFLVLKENPNATYSEISAKLGVSVATIKRSIQQLKKLELIAREGSDKTGKWIILK